MGVLQLDSVNVLTRAHQLPFFSRLGSYDRQQLDRWLWRSGEVVEHFPHVAALLPVDQYHLMAPRMESQRARRNLDTATLQYCRDVRDEIAERGPLAVAELRNGGSRTGPWWGHSPGKQAVSYLHQVGELAVADRRSNFELVVDLPERVIPTPQLPGPPADAEHARRELLVTAARAHGIGTAADLADYHRLGVTPARRTLADLVAEGRLERVAVEGWNEPAFLVPDMAVPRSVSGRALLSPFDPLVWFRPRVERMFGFHYRIEIYVPAPRRRYGYYVLPFLLGDALVARVDLKADRAAGVLRVRAAFSEPGHEPGAVVAALADELRSMALWLGLSEVAVEQRGDLSSPLRMAIHRA